MLIWQKAIRFKYKCFYSPVKGKVLVGTYIVITTWFYIDRFCVVAAQHRGQVSSSSVIMQTKKLYSGIPLLSSSPFSPCVIQLKGFPLLPWRCCDNSGASVQSKLHVPYGVPVKRGGEWGNGDWNQVFEKLKLCDFFPLRSCLSYEIVWNVRVVISVFTQGSLIQYRNKLITQESILNFDHISFHFRLHLSVLIFARITSASVY